MDTPDILSRLHDTLRATQRIRLPGPGCTAGAAVESVDEVKGMLRGLIRDLGSREPVRHTPRQVATAAAFPVGVGAGARPVVQHRRRVRRTCPDHLPRPSRRAPLRWPPEPRPRPCSRRRTRRRQADGEGAKPSPMSAFVYVPGLTDSLAT